MTRTALLALLWVLTSAGCGRPVPELPADPTDLTLVAIDGPGRERLRREALEREADGKGPDPEAAGVELLYGYPVLGRVRVTDPGKRREVVAALKDAIRGGPSQPARYFTPRHVPRVGTGDGAVDVVVCFECRRYRVYRAGGASGRPRRAHSTRPPSRTSTRCSRTPGCPWPQSRDLARRDRSVGPAATRTGGCGVRDRPSRPRGRLRRPPSPRPVRARHRPAPHPTDGSGKRTGGDGRTRHIGAGIVRALHADRPACGGRYRYAERDQTLVAEAEPVGQTDLTLGVNP